MARIAWLFPALAGGLAIALSASAQPAAPTGDAPDVATARRQADEPLRRPKVSTVWENVTTTTTPELRHRQSGAVCRFWAGRVFAGMHEPDDGQRAWCSTHLGGFLLETTIVPAAAAFRPSSQPATSDQSAGRTGPIGPREWVVRWTDLEHHEGPVLLEPQRSLTRPGGSPLTIHVARTDQAGTAEEIRHTAVVVRGWMIQQKARGPARQRAELDRLAETDLLRLAQTVSISRPAPALAQTPAPPARPASGAPPDDIGMQRELAAAALSEVGISPGRLAAVAPVVLSVSSPGSMETGAIVLQQPDFVSGWSGAAFFTSGHVQFLWPGPAVSGVTSAFVCGAEFPGRPPDFTFANVYGGPGGAVREKATAAVRGPYVVAVLRAEGGQAATQLSASGPWGFRGCVVWRLPPTSAAGAKAP